MKFQDRTIVITGGTSGIGKALLKALVGTCKEIIVIGRNKTELDSLDANYKNVTSYQCDLGCQHEIEATVDKIINTHPLVSLIINNAGIQNVATFLDDEFNFEEIEREIKINLNAPIWMCSLFLSHFLERGERTGFVNITTGLAIYPKTSSAVYCATKAGLRSFSKSFRYQLEDRSVSVIEAVMPMVDTPMTRGRAGKKMKLSRAAKAIIDGVESGKPEIYIGMAKLIPYIVRISPKLMAGILKKA